jgi:hypothetical protein
MRERTRVFLDMDLEELHARLLKRTRPPASAELHPTVLRALHALLVQVRQLRVDNQNDLTMRPE